MEIFRTISVMLRPYGLAVFAAVAAAVVQSSLDEFPEDHNDLFFTNKECCGNAPLPLACCPPPPPPKPCCQPAYGPCCPATPNCCPNPCCRGQRPEYEEEEEYEPTREEGIGAPTESINNPFAVQAPVSPVGIPPPYLRVKRAGVCLNLYNAHLVHPSAINKPSGDNDNEIMTTGGSGGCMKFPACVLAQKKRRKRHAERIEQYHKEVAAHKQALKEHEEQHLRQKRQFFSPDAGAACVPCPAWVTLALASRKKRSTNSSEESEEEQPPRMTLSEAIADIRRKAGYKLGFEVRFSELLYF
ncbi:hypothetical protein TELCIR_15640 [Teladorsagia circumcincta]|uniref:Granulin n=1 Tax=Teladorsagia circumcincta TaxID=45464 RepID=A0A2G9TXX4_TELCI|nr:hypothetical protein TELCIR_15640 [Teladorsagia circumcincta]